MVYHTANKRPSYGIGEIVNEHNAKIGRNERLRDEHTIDTLYGFDTEPGKELLFEVIEKLGVRALSDHAVTLLAEKHKTFHNQSIKSLYTKD